MNIFWPEGLQKLAESGEITFKDGERLNLNVLRRMDNGLYMISLKGKSFTAQLNFEPQGKTVRAEVLKTDSGQLQLKLIPKAESSANQMNIRVETAPVKPQAQQTVMTQSQTAQQAAMGIAKGAAPQQRLVFQIPAGLIDAKMGEQLNINVLKTLDNGNVLVSLKNNLFEVKPDLLPLLKSVSAEVIKTDGVIELAAARLPVQNLDPAFVKQEVGTFDIEKLMRAFGKFKTLDVANLTPDSLKQAVRDSGLFMENKLLKGESVSTDEKVRAIMNSDIPAKDGITKMQITNLLLAGGLLSFLKTQDENIDDTYLRLKKGSKGQNILYVSTKFSQLGETFIMIRNFNRQSDVMIKTETDISDMVKDIDIDNTRIHWFPFDKKDLKNMDVKSDIFFNMGKFEVII